MSISIDSKGLGLGGLGTLTDVSIFGDMTFEDIGKKALEECRETVVSETKAALRASIQHSGESELVNSVRSYEPIMTRNGEGVRLKCEPSGKSSSGNKYTTTNRGKSIKKPVRNNDKAFWLEYGVAGRQPKAPWKDRAMNNIEPKVTDIIENAVGKMLGAD